MSSFLQSPQVLVVEASAGSGKTYALARRYVQLCLHLASTQALPIQSILAITFTNKATLGMKSRILEFFVRRVTVEGYSMLPTYVPGERLTAWRRWRRVRVGDVVVVRDPRDPARWLLKRCVGINGGRLDLRGDNGEASTDSREFGLVSSREAVWIVPSHQV